MSLKIREVNFDSGKRIIVISDIHGNLTRFKNLLKKVNFCNEDYLIINGDFLEKGNDILNTLRFIMELSLQENVFVISGNCELLYLFVKSNVLDDDIEEYLNKRNESLIHEMFLQLKIDFSFNYKQVLYDNFKNEFDFLENLDHVLISEDFIFVHAGLNSLDLKNQRIEDVTEGKYFMNTELLFPKYVIVGHWPVCLYSKNKLQYNPLIDNVKKIISIDGGNVVKSSGQLNALIYDGDFDFVLEDEFEKVIVLEDQLESFDSFCITWPNLEIKVLKKQDEFSLCLHVFSQKIMEIANEYIDFSNSFLIDDYSNYELEVFKGDIVSLVLEKSNKYLAKKDGVVGWINQKIC